MKHQSSEYVVVIGGGFSGLATAGLLAASGHRVTLLEMQDSLGGRAGRLHRDGFSFDTGPSWYLMPEVIEHWFKLMGTSTTVELDLVDLEVGYRTWFQGHPDPLDMTTGPGAVAAFESVQTGAGVALEKYLAYAETSYGLALEHFLYDGFSSVRSLLNPRLPALLPRLAPLLSRSLDSFVAQRFSDPRLRQILGYPAVFLGSSPKHTPALYHLMSHLDLTQGVKYPLGGFAKLVDAMAELCTKAGVKIVTGATAEGIDTVQTGRHTRVDSVRWSDSRGETHRLDASVVVGAADLHHIESRLLPRKLRSSSDAAWKRRDPGPSAVLICLGIRGKLPKLLHHNLLFTQDWDENFGRIRRGEPLDTETSIYVCMPSATDPGVAPAGHENLFMLIPAPTLPEWGTGGADGNGSEQVEAVADAALAQLAAWAGIPDLAERIVVRQTFGPGDFVNNVNAWRGGALGLAHTLGQSAFFRPANRSAKVEGLHYAGSSVRPGVGVPMCLISAEITAKAVNGIKDLGPFSMDGQNRDAREPEGDVQEERVAK
ncbi:phytoene desaturase family protein [Paeniglutamicibacter kerguelensis]|uniref:Phytoene desaturase n=1 Tax=Paeniglutamicibacter kerguelensis TaxID=254788 RepID=A0ABS4XHP2_9MICC|nr:phytoene desaturase [Paeniglutamicibacter kerguelensis]